MNKREKYDALILQWMEFELEQAEESALDAELKRVAGSRTQLIDENDVIGLMKADERANAIRPALAA